MPVRATKRGADRTPLSGDFDVLVCGASFAGLAVARELRATGARVLVLDRYEIGERQTSACAAPTEWLRNLGPRGRRSGRPSTRWSSTPRAHGALAAAAGRSRPSTTGAVRAAVGPARAGDRVRDRQGRRAHRRRSSTPTAATSRAPLIVDALGWRRRARRRREVQPPEALLSRGLEVHPAGTRRRTSSCGSTSGSSRAGYGWSFPAGDEVRIGIGSFDPRDHVKEPTVAPGRATSACRPTATRATGSRTQLRPADRGRRLLRRRLRGPLHPADRRGDPHGVLLRHRLRARAARRARGRRSARAGARALRARSRPSTPGSSRAMLRWQHTVPAPAPRARDALARSFDQPPRARGRSGTTCASPRRSSRCPRRRRRRRRATSRPVAA